jgi:hypothetical protein
MFVTKALTRYDPVMGRKSKEPRWLCDLCAGSYVSVLDDSRAYNSELAWACKTMCYVGNAIIEAIRSTPSDDAGGKR